MFYWCFDRLLGSWIINEIEEFKTNFSGWAWKENYCDYFTTTEVDKAFNFQLGQETKGIHAADVRWSEPVGIKNIVSCWSLQQAGKSHSRHSNSGFQEQDFPWYANEIRLLDFNAL